MLHAQPLSADGDGQMIKAGLRLTLTDVTRANGTYSHGYMVNGNELSKKQFTNTMHNDSASKWKLIVGQPVKTQILLMYDEEQQSVTFSCKLRNGAGEVQPLQCIQKP